MRPRSIGRRLALQYLFMADVNRYDDIESPSEFFASQRAAARDNSSASPGDAVFDRFDSKQDDAEAFACALIREAENRRETIDGEIEKAARNWTLARMGVVERNVLRLVAAEAAMRDSPRNVILDEAVELAKRFGDKESGAFVNGIADRLVGGGGAESRQA